jgi:hypothetical protein
MIFRIKNITGHRWSQRRLGDSQGDRRDSTELKKNFFFFKLKDAVLIEKMDGGCWKAPWGTGLRTCPLFYLPNVVLRPYRKRGKKGHGV